MDFNDPSIRDIEAEYALLRSQSEEQTEKIEVLNQELHVLRNRAQVAERIQLECQSEVEYQQQQLSEIEALHAASLTRLREYHAATVEDLESRITCLETELSDVQVKSAVDKEELLKIRKELANFEDQSPVASLKAQLQEVMEEHASNRLACVQHQELNKVLLKEKADLLMELGSTKEHLETIDEKLKICKSDMSEQAETIEELRESLAVAQSELACLKAGPADAASRGNSLFAEVEDNRQAMLQKYSSMSKKYSEVKRDYGAKCDEISRLKLENLQLQRQWQKEADERDNRDVWLKDNYEIRIKELIEMVEDVKKEERPIYLNGDSKIMSYVDGEFEKLRKKVVMLRDEMERRSTVRLHEAEALYLARSELLKMKAELMSLRAENLILREKLQEADITDIPSPGKTIKRLNKILLSTHEEEDGHLSLEDDSSAHNVDMSHCKPVTPSSPPTLPLLCGASLPEKEVSNAKLSQECISFQEVPLRKPAISINEPSVTSLLCVPPKPKRLMELELIKKLESEDACSNIAHAAEDMQKAVPPQESSVSADLQEEIISSHSSENDHKLVSRNILEPVHESSMHGRSQSDIKALPVKTEASDSEAIVVNPHISSEPESTITHFVHPKKLDENFQGTNQQNVPRRSILAKMSRPSLIPIDQNSLSRKVRFAEETPPSFGAPKSEESFSKVDNASKKKLPKLPQPKSYKTKIVVSRETVLQQ